MEVPSNLTYLFELLYEVEIYEEVEAVSQVQVVIYDACAVEEVMGQLEPFIFWLLVV
jgi:hypothetical protein